MKIPGIKNLCSPALLYLILNGVIFFMLAIQYSSITYQSNGVGLSLIIQIIYILFWTWILNILCYNGLEIVAWIFFVFPFVVLYYMIGYQNNLGMNLYNAFF
jgi:hypothetical protein